MGARRVSAPENGVSRPKNGAAQEAYETLREAIVTAKLQPNERLVESDLIEMLSVSRSAVRTVAPRSG